MTLEQLKQAQRVVEELSAARWLVHFLAPGNTGNSFASAELVVRTGNYGTRQEPVELLPEELEVVRAARRRRVEELEKELTTLGVDIEPDNRIPTVF